MYIAMINVYRYMNAKRCFNYPYLIFTLMEEIVRITYVYLQNGIVTRNVFYFFFFSFLYYGLSSKFIVHKSRVKRNNYRGVKLVGRCIYGKAGSRVI